MANACNLEAHTNSAAVAANCHAHPRRSLAGEGMDGNDPDGNSKQPLKPWAHDAIVVKLKRSSHGGGPHQSYRTACTVGLSGNHVVTAKGISNGCCSGCGIGSSCGIGGCGIKGFGNRRAKPGTKPVITDRRQDGWRGGARRTKTNRARK